MRYHKYFHASKEEIDKIEKFCKYSKLGSWVLIPSTVIYSVANLIMSIPLAIIGLVGIMIGFVILVRTLYLY